LPDGESEIFFAKGMDRANQLEAVTENRRPGKPSKPPVNRLRANLPHPEKRTKTYSVFERKPAPDLIRVDTGSREDNASKQEARASVLIQSEPIML
jgi:hypothetical protein